MDKEETFNYINHRIKVAGGNGPIFSSLAIEKIYDLSKGLPRKINKLASTSLLHAYLSEKNTVDDNIVAQAVKEIE